MFEVIKSFQIRAGLELLSPMVLVIILLGGSAALVSLVLLLTSAVSIAISCLICVLFQVVDTLKNRIRKLERQQNLDWPKYLDAIHSAAWSGNSLQQSLLDCRNFAPKGTSAAITEFEKDLSAGMTFDNSLMNLKSRLGNPIADRFIEITRLAHLSGGNGFLAALRSQALQLRLENATWQEIEVKQSWLMSSARMAVYAPWLVLLLLTSRPETSQVFANETGLLVLLIGLAGTVGAFQLIRLLGELPKRQRVLGDSK